MKKISIKIHNRLWNESYINSGENKKGKQLKKKWKEKQHQLLQTKKKKTGKEKIRKKEREQKKGINNI